jgi:hypothetical protein
MGIILQIGIKDLKETLEILGLLQLQQKINQ